MTGSAEVIAWIGGLSGLAAVVLNIVVALRGGAWGMADRLGKMEARLMAMIVENKQEAEERGDKRHLEIDRRLETHEHDIGEGLRALQQKIHEVEKWSRDEFVRRDDFQDAIRRIETVATGTSSKIDTMQTLMVKIAAAIGGGPTRLSETP